MRKFKINTRILVFLLGVGLALTQSAFTTFNTPNYGFNQQIGAWQTLSGLTERTASGALEENEYRCNSSEHNCKAYFANGPSDINDPDDPTAENVVTGTFQVNMGE